MRRRRHESQDEFLRRKYPAWRGPIPTAYGVAGVVCFSWGGIQGLVSWTWDGVFLGTVSLLIGVGFAYGLFLDWKERN